MTVFVPMVTAAAKTLRDTGVARDLVGHADGPALRAWLGDAGVDDEEADYVALNHAGVAALLIGGSGSRLVLAVEADVSGVDELGTVRLPEVRWADVRCLFADEAAAADAVAAARAAVTGIELGEALTEPAVEELLDGHDLLWYAPEELDALSDP